MNPFANSDEPTAPDWFMPGKRFRNLMWWLRNPLHNLCFVTLRRPVVRPVYIAGAPELHHVQDSGGYADEVHNNIVLRFNPFFLKLGPAFIGWRSDKPHRDAFGGVYGPGGGAFDLGIKDLG